jgi:hypothetical protein
VKHVVEINKYFRNHHTLSALLNACLGSTRPQLPGETRWISQLTCLDSYIKNSAYMMQIIQDHPDDIDGQIQQKVMNVGLYRQVCDLADQRSPVAAALDRTQTDSTNLADAYDIMSSLMTEPVLAPHSDQAILHCHIVAYMLHPKYTGQGMD